MKMHIFVRALEMRETVFSEQNRIERKTEPSAFDEREVFYIVESNKHVKKIKNISTRHLTVLTTCVIPNI